jgi:hypothetical protein
MEERLLEEELRLDGFGSSRMFAAAAAAADNEVGD